MSKKNEELSLEKMFTELEKIIEDLQNGEKNLEESLKTYERGMKLCLKCESELKNAKLEINKFEDGISEE